MISIKCVFTLRNRSLISNLKKNASNFDVYMLKPTISLYYEKFSVEEEELAPSLENRQKLAKKLQK